jgi:hypothetical protein
MKYTADFLNDHNILAIVEDLLAQPVDCFREGQIGGIEHNARICWELLQRYNHLLQDNESSYSEQGISRKRLLNQELERLRYFAQSLWRALIEETQEVLWLEWLKAGLVKIADASIHSVTLGAAVNA